MTILDEILASKRKELSQLKNHVFKQTDHKNVMTFREKVTASNQLNIIAEFKRASPSKGAIQMALNPATQAKKYEALGASAISVLTDYPFFKGSIEDLAHVRAAVDLPILCKDFIIDTVQIDQAKTAGANIILLIVAALDHKDL